MVGHFHIMIMRGELSENITVELLGVTQKTNIYELSHLSGQIIKSSFILLKFGKNEGM